MFRRMSTSDLPASSEGLVREVCPPGWPKLHSSGLSMLCAMDLPVSSKELVREVCSLDQLRMYSSDVPVLVHVMCRTFQRMQWTYHITFGTGVYILRMFRRIRRRNSTEGRQTF